MITPDVFDVVEADYNDLNAASIWISVGCQRATSTVTEKSKKLASTSCVETKVQGMFAFLRVRNGSR